MTRRAELAYQYCQRLENGIVSGYNFVIIIIRLNAKKLSQCFLKYYSLKRIMGFFTAV